MLCDIPPYIFYIGSEFPKVDFFNEMEPTNKYQYNRVRPAMLVLIWRGKNKDNQLLFSKFYEYEEIQFNHERTVV